MAETNPPTEANEQTDRPLRLLVFGRSGSGKSALLAGMAEAAREGQHAVQSPAGLEQPGRQRLPVGTSSALACRVRYAPAGEYENIDAVLMDTEGLAASELLSQIDVLQENNPDVPLARDVVEADALILTVDAAGSPQSLEADFAAFKNLLRIVQERRGESTDVGGVPVFLVLTHADLLAQPNDSLREWNDRLEERKREVDQQFRASLDEDESSEAETVDEETEEPADEPPTPEFGWIDLHVWATAIKRPRLRDDKATGAYGVAELFRQCLEEAADYRRDWQKSQRRLKGMVLGVVALGLLLVGLAGARLATDVDGRTALLASRVEDLRSSFGTTPSEYLRGTVAQLRDEEMRFGEVRNDAQFRHLPADQRAFVEERLAELSAYIGYFERLSGAQTPFDVWTTEGLERLLARLKRGELALPRKTWAETPAGLLYQERVQTTAALLEGVRQLQRWYRESSAEADKLWTFANYPPQPGGGIPGSWVADVADLLAPGKRSPPWRSSDPLPGSPPGLLTYADALRFYEVKDAQVGWEVDRDRLAGLLDLVAALEVVKDVPEHPPLLVFTAADFRWTGTNWQGFGSFRLKNVPERLTRLKTVYPHYNRDFGGILPDRIAAVVRQKAREQYKAVLAPARAEVQRHLRMQGDGKKETARWSAVAKWLGTSEELDRWNELAMVLLRIIQEQPEAPVPALRRFLATREFTLEFKTVVVEIQRFSPLEPSDEPLKVVWQGEEKKELVFNRKGNAKVAGSVTQYTWSLAEKATIEYRPGQDLYAELPLKGQDLTKQRLVWVDSRSLYQFERLRARPRLQEWREGNPPALREGRPQSDVRLRLEPSSGVPPVPDLMPEVQGAE